MKKKVLLITHPVDFGNNIVERNLVELFDEYTNLIHFSYSNMKNEKSGIKYMKRLIPFRSRIQSMIKLYTSVIRSNDLQDYTIVFQGISPVLFSFFFFINRRKILIIDWTRKLYEPMRNKKMSPFWLTIIHKKVLKSCNRILCVTSSVRQSIIKDYGINPDIVHKVILPFNTTSFKAGEKRNDSEIRLLFVGGDFIRKGGDLLINWYKNSNNKNVKLTIVTQEDYDWPEGVELIKNDPIKGIKDEFPKHDIFVMPTRWDSYPQVLIEAAASGLAIVTSRFALGSPDIVENQRNGYICGDFNEFFQKLQFLINNPKIVEEFKINSPLIATNVYNPQKVFKLIEQFL